MKPLFVVVALVLSVLAGAEGRAVPGIAETGQIGPVGVSVTPLNLAAEGSQ